MSSLSFETPEDMPRGMKALYEAKMAKERTKQTAAAFPEPKPKIKGGKYHAEKCAIGEMKFDSKKEARRWAELYAMEQRGEISDLRTQVKFVLVPTQREPDVDELAKALPEYFDRVIVDSVRCSKKKRLT